MTTPFEIQIFFGCPNHSGSEIPLTFFCPEFGSGMGWLKNPLDDPEFIDELEIFYQGQAKPPIYEKIGKRLFQSIFHDPAIQQYYWNIVGASKKANRMLLFHIQSTDPAIGGLPWELLNSDSADGKGEFLAQQPWFNLVFSLPQTWWNPSAEDPQMPVKILVGYAAPAGWQPLDGKQEINALRNLLHPYEQKGKVLLQVEEHLTRRVLFQALREHRPYIFHFIGHAWTDPRRGSFLVLEDENGQEDFLLPQELSGMVGKSAPDFVFLNACYTGRTTADHWSIAEKFLNLGSRWVLTNLTRILDSQARQHAIIFFQSVLAGLSMEQALVEARSSLLAIFPTPRSLWYSPRLYVNCGEVVNPLKVQTNALAHILQSTSVYRASKGRFLGGVLRLLGLSEIEFQMKVIRILGPNLEVLYPHSIGIKELTGFRWKLGEEIVKELKPLADFFDDPIYIRAFITVMDQRKIIWQSQETLIDVSGFEDSKIEGELEREISLSGECIIPGEYVWQLNLNIPYLDRENELSMRCMVVESAFLLLSEQEIKEYEDIVCLIPEDMDESEKMLIQGSAAVMTGRFEEALACFHQASKNEDFTEFAHYLEWKIWSRRAIGKLNENRDALLSMPIQLFAEKANAIYHRNSNNDRKGSCPCG